VVGGDVEEVAEELDEDEEHAVATASRAAAAQHHTVFLSISIHLVGSRLPDRDPATGSNGIRTLARACADPRTLSTRLHHDDSHPTVQHNHFHKTPSPTGCGLRGRSPSEAKRRPKIRNSGAGSMVDFIRYIIGPQSVSLPATAGTIADRDGYPP
jgi:hypothetical protein